MCDFPKILPQNFRLGNHISRRLTTILVSYNTDFVFSSYFFFLQDCHGGKDGRRAPVQDDTQNYHVESGYQNLTHTTVTFRRALETCDPHDVIIGVSFVATFTAGVGGRVILFALFSHGCLVISGEQQVNNKSEREIYLLKLNSQENFLDDSNRIRNEVPFCISHSTRK